MSTSNSFAYNPGSPIDGTTQVGDLSVGVPTSGFTNSPQFWNGPDQDLGYVIAKPVPDNTQPTPVSGVNASLGFWGTKYMTNPLSDTTFIQLSEYVSNKVGSPQTFSTATDASTWLTSNGYWNSYGLGGGWYLYNEYSDAPIAGSITFPNHAAGTGCLNPNYVGQFSPGYDVQLYINYYDNSSTSYYSSLSPIAGNYGTLTLAQNSNTVTYAFTNNGFQNSGTELYSDNYFGSSVPGSITILNPSTSDFNTNDIILISHTIFPSGYTFTIDSSMLNGLGNAGLPQYGSANGTAGFTVTNQINNLLGGVYGQLNTTTEIESAFTAAGATMDNNGYIVTVQWGSGSDIQEGIAKVSYNSISQNFYVTSVDSADNNFTQQYTNAGSNLPGTFNFPATFTFISPLIHKSDWC